MTGQLKRNFQTIYFDEMCFFSMYIYIYGVIYTEKTYMVSIIHKTILMKLGKILDYWFILHSLSQIPIYTRGLRVYKLN